MKYVLLLLIPLTLFARQRTYDYLASTNPPYIPWFTGSLLPPAATNAPVGHLILAPFLGFTLTYGRYENNGRFQSTSNTYAINPFLEFFLGLTDHIGVDLYASFISNFKKGQTATHLQDTIILLGLQLAKDRPNSWIPDLRLCLQETFPTGNYQKLNPNKMGIDSTGQGTFQTGFNLIAQKLFPLNRNFLLLKWTLAYLFPAPVHVKGYNTFGGGPGTSGKVYPGQTLLLYFSGEYSFSQRWVFAFDTFLQYQQKSPFSGTKGMSNGLPNTVGLPPTLQLSIAPEIEYNLSSTSGLLLAFWGTIWGRNAPAFASTAISYYITF